MYTQLTTAKTNNYITLSTKVFNFASKRDDFLSYTDIKKTSLKTYERGLNLWRDWVVNSGRKFERLTMADVITYKNELLEHGKVSTVASYLTALRSFYTWTAKMGYYPNIAEGVKNPPKRTTIKHKPLTLAQSSMITTWADGQSLRDFAMVNLITRTGLRTVEVSNADVADLEERGGVWVLNVQGKGRFEKDNFVPLHPKALQPIREYLASRGLRPGESCDGVPLFVGDGPNQTGARISTRTVSRVCKRALEGIGLDEKRVYTAHSLRHTKACNMLRAGRTMFDVQKTLRHKNIATTQIYTEWFEEETRLSSPNLFADDNLF